ncbi:GTPase IMAP family member 4 isoform X1 [Etheostoma spectabile]|uniref:GTPase IMAP family member 4 isoform X1 n=1 Tax=Etheostoma spectabile TaxID=54343 RepID=UPI0013AEFD70|nr:GTPase IMAP family member 4-like isoform X1 [Etheostoma spectabile]
MASFNGPDWRIGMIGKAVVSKSASGNTILEERRFKSCFSSESVTETCETGVTRWGNRGVSVVDTPGILDTQKSPEFIQREIMRRVEVSRPDPDLQRLIKSCGNRFQVFDDPSDDRGQVVGLAEKIDDMVAANTDAMFQEVKGTQEMSLRRSIAARDEQHGYSYSYSSHSSYNASYVSTTFFQQ